MPDDNIVSKIEIRQQKLSNNEYKPKKQFDPVNGKYTKYDDNKKKPKIKFTGASETRKYIITSFYPHLDKKYYDENFNVLFNQKIDGYYERNRGSYDSVKKYCSSSIIPIKDNKIQGDLLGEMIGIIYDTSGLDYLYYDWHDGWMNNGKKMSHPTLLSQEQKDDLVKKIKLKYNNTNYEKQKDWAIKTKIMTTYQPINQDIENRQKLIQFALEQKERHSLNQSKIHSTGDAINCFHKLGGSYRRKICHYNELSMMAQPNTKVVKTKGIVINIESRGFLREQPVQEEDIQDIENIVNFLELKKIPFVYIIDKDKNFKISKISEFIQQYIDQKQKYIKKDTDKQRLQTLKTTALDFEKKQIDYIISNKAIKLNIGKEKLIKYLSNKYQGESEIQLVDHLLNDFDDVQKDFKKEQSKEDNVAIKKEINLQQDKQNKENYKNEIKVEDKKEEKKENEATKKEFISNQEIYKGYLTKYQDQDYKEKIKQMAEETTEPIEMDTDVLPPQDAIDKVKKNKEELDKIIDKLPPEFYTLCKIVDGINEKKHINIFLIPILNPVYNSDGKLAQSIGGLNNRKDEVECNNKQKTDKLYTEIITNKYKELLDKKQPFGIMYVDCSKYILQHCTGFVHYFDKKGQQTIYNIDYFVGQRNFNKYFFNNITTINPDYDTNFTDNNGKTITIKRIEHNMQTDFFGCRLQAIKLLTSLLKKDCDNIKTFEDYQKEMLDKIETLGKDERDNIDTKLIHLDNDYYERYNKIRFDYLNNLGPKGFIKYSQIGRQTLKDIGIDGKKLNKIYRKNPNDKKDDKEYNIGNAKKLTELYYKYAKEKFLEEHNNIVKCLIGKNSEAVNHDLAGYKEVIDETYEKLLKDEQKKRQQEKQLQIKKTQSIKPLEVRMKPPLIKPLKIITNNTQQHQNIAPDTLERKDDKTKQQDKIIKKNNKGNEQIKINEQRKILPNVNVNNVHREILNSKKNNQIHKLLNTKKNNQIHFNNDYRTKDDIFPKLYVHNNGMWNNNQVHINNNQYRQILNNKKNIFPKLYAHNNGMWNNNQVHINNNQYREILNSKKNNQFPANNDYRTKNDIFPNLFFPSLHSNINNRMRFNFNLPKQVNKYNNKGLNHH